MKHKNYLLKCVCCALILTVGYSSCNRRYWFRKKVNVNKNDTAEVEKEYHIAW